jgi:signal transduction histidine kinase
MKNKVIIFIAIILSSIIILEPWLVSSFSVFSIYLFNVLASFCFLAIIIGLIKKIKKDSLKKEVVSLTAHQLSSPLASIKWSLEMLLNKDFGNINSEQKKVIEAINKKNSNLIYLVEDLLDTAKIENGNYFLDNDVCDIEEIIDSIINFYKDEIIKKKIDFKFQKSAKKPRKIAGDKQKIKLAVQNLIENAIKYTPPGGKILILLKEKNKEIEFKIQDNGIGIENIYQKKIFSKFFRSEKAIKQEPMGYGLGLFFVKKIIESHGGKVWFKSSENKGSSFHFTIPFRKIT